MPRFCLERVLNRIKNGGILPPFIFSQIQKDALSDVERVSAFLVEVENKITLLRAQHSLFAAYAQAFLIVENSHYVETCCGCNVQHIHLAAQYVYRIAVKVDEIFPVVEVTADFVFVVEFVFGVGGVL